MRGKRMATGAAALVLVAGGIAAATIVGGGHRADEPLVSTPPPPTDTRSAAAEVPLNAGWQVISDPDADIGYELPSGWTLAADTQSVLASSGVELRHLADFGTYVCQGAEYGRAFSGSGVATGTDTAEIATEIAGAVAADQYSDGSQTAKVSTGRPTPIVRDGARGSMVRANAEASETDADPCASTKGTVIVIALPSPRGVSVVVVTSDTERGVEPTAPLVSEEDLSRIADSVRPR